MNNQGEPTLQELAARYEDSEEEVAEPENPHYRPTEGEQSLLAANGKDVGGAGAQLAPQGAWEVDEDEDDWDSEDEELASAMEWADLRDGSSFY